MEGEGEEGIPQISLEGAWMLLIAESYFGWDFWKNY